MLEYEELRIRAWKTGQNRYLVFANGAAAAAAVIHLEKTPEQYLQLLDELLKEEFGHSKKTADRTVRERVRELGRELFAAFFPGPIRACFRRCLEQAHQQNRGLRLRFEVDPELLDIPFELIQSSTDDPLGAAALRPLVSPVRSLPGTPLPSSRLPQPDEKPGIPALLVVAPAPNGRPTLNAALEISSVRKSLPGYWKRKNSDPLQVLGSAAATTKATSGAVDGLFARNGDRPCAALIIAHGEYDQQSKEIQLVLEHKNGEAELVPADQLAALLTRALGLRLVVLNLCLGARAVPSEPFSGLARALIAAGIPAVVAMQSEVSDQAAAAFSPALFGEISQNRTIDEAVAAGRRAIAAARQGHVEWCNPVLFLHRSYGDGWLFKTPMIQVGEGNAPDPIREGFEIVDRAQKQLSVTNYEAAAYFMRRREDWEEVIFYAEELKSKGLPNAREHERLWFEAKTELRADDCQELCKILAKGDQFQDAESILSELEEVLEPCIHQRLAQEVAEAIAVEKIYSSALNAEQQEEWGFAVGQYGKILGDGDQLPGLRAQGYRDVKERLGEVHKHHRYAQGRSEEAAETWAEAARHYSAKELRGYRDVAQRRPYAQARAAEEAGAWAKAAERYSGLERSFADIEKRLPYVRGRQAETAGAWQAVIDGFGNLGDDEFGGEVGLRRCYARAREDEAKSHWPGVVEALGELPDAGCEGELGRLRRYAKARLAEEEDDWAAAAAKYGELDDAWRIDVAGRRAYARGRAAEAAERWAEAVAAFGSLEGASFPAETTRDAVERRAYAHGRLAEATEAWSDAITAYEALAPETRDVAPRLARVRAFQAQCLGDWPGVIAALEPLEHEIPETRDLLPYAHGRIAEEKLDWPLAASSFGACGDHLDARERAPYALGRQEESRGRWRWALEHLRSLAAGLWDIAERRERLEKLLAAVPWLDGLASEAAVADPLALRQPGWPYALLKPAGITPGSTAQEVKDASFSLMEQGAMTAETRRAWDQLRTLPGRLRIDAFLYPLREPEALERIQQQLDPGSPETLLEQLAHKLDRDAPLLLLLDGHREQAIELWKKRQTQAPHDMATVHALALSHLWQARELEANGAREHADRAWRQAIAQWARVLSEDDWWETWRQERTVRYGQPMTRGDFARLRRELGQQLLEELGDAAERSAARGRAERAATWRNLGLALEAELEGARVLKEAGGLPIGEPADGGLVCGLLYLGHAQLGERLARHLARLEAERAADRESDDDFRTPLDLALGTGETEENESSLTADTLFRLRCAFSELGPALLLLESHQPERALAALPDLHRTPLNKLPADCTGYDRPEDELPIHPPDCPHCRRFLERDPAYLRLGHRQTRLLQDAVALAIRARLALARGVLTGRREGLEQALGHWREAIAVARNAGAQVRAKRAIARMVIGRAEALEGEHGREREQRLSEAIELLEQARQLIGDGDGKQLAAKTAEILAIRGVWYGYGCHEYQDPDYQKAARDLRRALELTPDSLHARDNLARALMFHAAHLPHEQGFGEPFELFAEAIEVLHAGLGRTAGHRQLRGVLRQALDQLEERMLFELSPAELARRIAEVRAAPAADGSAAGTTRPLTEHAAQQLSNGDLTGALITLIEAVRRDDGDPVARDQLVGALRRQAQTLREGGAKC